ncbi:MAG: integrase family protein [Pseudomonadota bacterium]|nr:integrase family protein [Pseudomonadota bacterium]
MSKIKINKTNVEKIPFTEKGQKMYLDTELKGFGLLVGKKNKSYFAQKDIKGKSQRISIGRHGVWTAELARKEAQELLRQMDKGINPVAEKKAEEANKITLGDALKIHLNKLKREKRAQRSMETYIYNIEKGLSDWLGRNLQDITRTEVRERHDKMTKERGSYAANNTMKNLRAVYNTLMKEYDNIPVSPTIAVHWNKEYRRQEPIAEEQLKYWYEKVKRLKNPVRQDWQVFVIFTGLRKTDACSIRWEDVDLQKGSLHRPNPKGGETRAFTLPLSDVCLEILKRRKKDNPKFFGKDCPWVFPSFDPNRNVIRMKEPKERRIGLPTPHRLRDTYTTIANAVGLSPYDIDVLTNHRPPIGHVTAGYIRQDFEHLRKEQQKIADYLKKHLGMK